MGPKLGSYDERQSQHTLSLSELKIDTVQKWFTGRQRLNDQIAGKINTHLHKHTFMATRKQIGNYSQSQMRIVSKQSFKKQVR